MMTMMTTGIGRKTRDLSGWKLERLGEEGLDFGDLVVKCVVIPYGDQNLISFKRPPKKTHSSNLWLECLGIPKASQNIISDWVKQNPPKKLLPLKFMTLESAGGYIFLS